MLITVLAPLGLKRGKNCRSKTAEYIFSPLQGFRGNFLPEKMPITVLTPLGLLTEMCRKKAVENINSVGGSVGNFVGQKRPITVSTPSGLQTEICREKKRLKY